MNVGCNLTRRIERDRERGKETSAQAMLFLARTCPCDGCAEWRRSERERRGNVGQVRDK